VEETEESQTSERVRVVKIAPEHLHTDSWIVYRLDTSEWIEQIKSFLEQDNQAHLTIQVEEMDEADFERLPEY